MVQVEAAVEAGEGWRTEEMTRGNKPSSWWRQRMEERGRRIVKTEFKDFEPELGGERRRVYENQDREGMHINWSASGWK